MNAMSCNEGNGLFGDTEALVGLLTALDARDYSFVTPTPSTCQRMLERGPGGRPTLRDIFGWSFTFTEADLDGELIALLRRANALERSDGGLRSLVRVSTVHGLAFLHSAATATAADAVFLGPDSYRFADFLVSELPAGEPVGRIVDVGAGAGVGALTAAVWTGSAAATLTDINARALRLAAANAAHSGVEAHLRLASGLEGVEPGIDLIVANPPYVAGSSGRIYKDGGDLHGARLSLDWAVAGMERLAPGGRMLIYTGSSILSGGVDQFQLHLRRAAAARGFAMSYRELDPDVFPGELRGPAYAEVERIAAVGAVLTAPR